MSMYENEMYSLVADKDGNPVYDDAGNILTLKESDGTIAHMEYALALKVFPSLLEANDCAQGAVTGESAGPSQSRESRTVWDSSEIKELIRLYKDHLPQFKNTTLKNDKVWQMIADHLQNRTMDQVKNKFKYLKSKYTEKKDNMKCKSSGAAVIKFQYLNEMDEIFARDANICPVSTASSARGRQNLSLNIDAENSNHSPKVDDGGDPPHNNREKPPSPKRKRSQLAAQLDRYETNSKLRESARQNRHEELLQRQDAALYILKSIAQSFANISSSSK